MSVKRFVAADMRRALELVRNEMGPDAIILSSKRIKQGVEILTSSEPPVQQTEAKATQLHGMKATEVPMGSDSAWREQQAVDKAVAARRDSISSGHSISPNHAPVSSLTPARNTSSDNVHSNDVPVPVDRGLASGKTQNQLAAELDMARARMLAAKEAERFSNTSISELSEEMQAPVSVAKPRIEPTVSRQSMTDAMSAGVNAKGNTAASTQEQDQQLDALQAELADMRMLLEDQLNRMARTPINNNPIVAGILRRFNHVGLPETEAAAIAERITEQHSIKHAWKEGMALLARSLPVNQTDLVMQGGVFAFVGATGVGKTTTIAKLAARYVLEHGAENVTLVTTDTYRIAAHDQLRSLGRIMNVQVKVVEDNRDLPAVLSGLKHCPLVLIDTAGFRTGDAHLKEQLDALALTPNIQTLLVMSGNTQPQLLKASVHAHQSANLAGCVLTKLDESASLGEALGVVLEHQLPVSYVTNGQDIPADLAVARGHQLVAKAVALSMAGMGGRQIA